MVSRRFGSLLVAIPLLTGATLTAQTPPASFSGPLAPQPPDVIARDSEGRATIRAVPVPDAMRVDGALDEPLYTTPSMSGYVQVEPQQGAPPTEQTETWFAFDRDNVYISFRVWDSHPERRVTKDLRRDGSAMFSGDDVLYFFLDTFYDRRTGFTMTINSLGGRSDGQVTGDQYNGDWNPIYDVAVGKFEGGWTAEVALPFKSLRYRAGQAQIWGFNAARTVRWRNEISALVPVPPWRALSAARQAQLAGTVVGIEAPPPSANLEIKPYVASSATTNALVTPRVSNDVSSEFGVDLKYSLTPNLTADFTYNTDFAQVEADEQQVNLSRFSLFFPEKREFFLENPGLFAFGGVAVNSGQPTSDAPMLFYSRRIGLNQGRVVPLTAGGRLTGRVGRYAVGLMTIQTGDETVSRSPSTNFSLVRVRRDILRKSSIGVIATGRSVTTKGTGSNAVFGVDGAFSFFENLFFDTYWARTQTTGLSGDDTSYRGALAYAGDRYGVELERLAVGNNFNPEVGFVRRYDKRQSSGSLRFSPRPKSSKVIRKYSWQGSINYVENRAGRLETRDDEGRFDIEFQNSDRSTASYVSSYEFLPRPFRIASGIVLPVRGYDSGKIRLAHTLGTQRVMSGTAAVEYGTFYSGHRLAMGLSSGRLKVTSQFSLEPTYSINKVDLLEGSFTTHLAGSRIYYSMTPLMFASALLQYNSTNHLMSANARLRWEYAPGSELFVVYNEERDTLDGIGAPRFPELANRSFIIKITRLLRF